MITDLLTDDPHCSCSNLELNKNQQPGNYHKWFNIPKRGYDTYSKRKIHCLRSTEDKLFGCRSECLGDYTAK